jgi:flavodoxin
MRACVIFDTRYGNTEKIAKSFETGLKEAGIQTVCANAKDVAVDSLKQYGLICVGAPTEAFTASKPMKEFLGKLKSTDLSGKYGFAFDTKLGSSFSGSAAKFIEKELNNLGLQIIAPRESAIVFGVKEEEGGARLKEGEEKRFEQIGLQVGTMKAHSGGNPVAGLSDHLVRKSRSYLSSVTVLPQIWCVFFRVFSKPAPV